MTSKTETGGETDEQATEDIHAADESEWVTFEYHDAVHDEEVRIVASPYYGDYQEAADGDEWVVTYEKRAAGTEGWARFATDYASEKPEVEA